MTKRIASGIGMVCLVGLAAGVVPAADPPPNKVVRIGLVGSLFHNTPEAVIQLALRPLRSMLEAQMGVKGEMLPGGDAMSLGKSLAEDKVQLGVFHGLEFAWARAKYPELKPLVVALNHAKYPRCYLVVRDETGAAALDGLAGKTLAVPPVRGIHCRAFFERKSAPAGTTPAKFYGSITTPPDAIEALDDVYDGIAQAAVVDALSLDNYKEQKPKRSGKLRIVLESDPFPPAVLAYRPGSLPEETVKTVQTSLLDARNNDRGRRMLDMIRLVSFENVPADFDELLTEVNKTYPPPAEPRK